MVGVKKYYIDEILNHFRLPGNTRCCMESELDYPDLYFALGDKIDLDTLAYFFEKCLKKTEGYNGGIHTREELFSQGIPIPEKKTKITIPEVRRYYSKILDELYSKLNEENEREIKNVIVTDVTPKSMVENKKPIFFHVDDDGETIIIPETISDKGWIPDQDFKIIPDHESNVGYGPSPDYEPDQEYGTNKKIISKINFGSVKTNRFGLKKKTKKSPNRNYRKLETGNKPGSKPIKRKRGRKKTDKELDQVWKTYKETGDENLRNVLIENYMPLVKYISERLMLTLPKSIEVDDITSAGVFGLMDAIDGFDLERGIKFKTYCTTRVRGSMLDELRKQDWVPRLVRLKAHQINKSLKNLEKKNGRTPNNYEIAKSLNISLKEFNMMAEEATPRLVYSLSDKWDEQNDDEAVEKVEMIEDKNAVDPVEILNRKDTFRYLLKDASKKEKIIFIMYYYEKKTFRDIGNMLNLTESRVCQIHSNSLTRLKLSLYKEKSRLLTI